MIKKYQLLFTQEELAILDEALSALPYGRVAPLIFNINSQMEEAHRNSRVESEESASKKTAQNPT